MFTHETKLRVRYGETDQMGYLYYGNYAQYYEVGRVEMLRSVGLSYKEMEEIHGVLMPVMSLNMRYIRPAHYDNLLTIKTTLRQLPKSTVTFHVEIYNEQAEMVNGGSVKLCFVNGQTKESVDAPDFLLDKIKPYFSE